MKDIPILTPDTASFSRGDPGTLVLHVKDEPDHIVGIRRMFPVSRPGEFLSIHDEQNEIAVIADLSVFSREQQRLVKEEIGHQYFVPRITEIRAIKDEFGYFMWDVVTDRGPRKFYVQGRTDNLHSHRRSRSGGPTVNVHTHGQFRMFVTDIEDCKYEIEDCRELSRTSRTFLETVM